MPVQQISVKNTSDIEHFEWSMAPYTPSVHGEAIRIGSSSSQTSYSNSSGDICRICHCESDSHNPLLAPCYCSGSLKYVHQSCLQQWLTASETRSCELCKFHFIMHTKIKPFNEWRRLEMSGVERRRLCCAVLFHCIAVLCVMWSLFVLIDRAAEEMQRGLIAWPFWTKLVVVTVGFTGGAVFMYIQCRQYLHLCNRWRAHNRILLIQNAPEKAGAIPPSPVLQHVTVQTGRRQRELERHGQIVANIENNPRGGAVDSNSQSSNTTRQLNVEHHPVPDEKVQFHRPSITDQNTSFLPHNMATLYKEEDESGGFDTYKFNVNRRISALDSGVHPDKEASNVHIYSQIPDRRYSDTRLLQSFDHKVMQFHDSSNTSIIVERAISEYNRTKNNSDVEPSTSYRNDKSVYHISSKADNPCVAVHPCEIQPQVSDIDFECCENDPLEFNIQQMLELDIENSQKRKKSLLSLNQNPSFGYHRSNDSNDTHKSVFKSLPNLSSSSENLLPKLNS